jgi:hypothetical protein
MRLLGPDEKVVTGELHITHQRPDGEGTSHLHQDGILVVVIPLRLPVEERDYETKTEEWFIKMGLTKLPDLGSSHAAPFPVDLEIFDYQLRGPWREVTQYCTKPYAYKDPRWILLETPAYITGNVVQAFKNKFPYSNVLGDGYTGEYLVDGKINTISYDEFGREHLAGVADASKKEDDGLPADAHWVENSEWVPGSAEFMPWGQWWLPPSTPSPTSGPTYPRITAPIQWTMR